MRNTKLALAMACCSGPFATIMGQQSPPLTRAQAIAAALATNPRLAGARADSAAAAARGITAGALPNPTISASYTKDIPQYHLTAEMPIDQLWLRGARVSAAKASQRAAQYRLQYEIASLTLDVDTSYTRALATAAHRELSTQNARAADSLRRIAAARRDAGDASDLDVDLASLTAGQQAAAAAADSVATEIALLALRSIIGGTADATVGLADSLDIRTDLAAQATVPPPTQPSLLVQSGRSAVDAASLNARVQHRNVFGSPGIIVGFDTHDPTGETAGLLPVFGVAVPLPIFNRNRGPIAEAEAERARAVADLQVAELESQLQVARARGTLLAAATRVERDRQLLEIAARVSAKALTAYREGAATLASVLEAQRSARDVQGQFIDDVANALIAAATLRLVTLTSSTAGQ
jgi:cobalt-zinc-cadmium efflux system outer membrane protein